MKRILLLTLLLASAIFSCKKDEGIVENNGLVGRWKLTEILSDPGDGSGKFIEIKEYETRLLEFGTNGDFKEIKGMVYSSINPYNFYKVLDNNRIELSMKNDTITRPTMTWTYKNLSPTSLVVGFGCDEPCLGKFVAIR